MVLFLPGDPGRVNADPKTMVSAIARPLQTQGYRIN
jgi:hypothetical protein